MSTVIVYGVVRGGPGTAGQALAYNGSFWVPAAALPTGSPGTAQSAWNDGDTIQIAVPAPSSGGGGSGGGSTTVGVAFAMPAVWTFAAPTTLLVAFGSTAQMSDGAGLTIPSFGSFIVAGTPPDSTHAFVLNTGAAGNVIPTTTIPSGTPVNIAGSGAPLAAQARLPGQALQLSQVGADTPGGITTVRHALSYDNGTMGTPTVAGDITHALKAAIADAALAVPVFVPVGQNSVSEPILTRTGLTIRGVSYLPNTSFGPTTIINTGLGTRYGGVMLGPVFAVVPTAAPAAAPTYSQRGNFYFLNTPAGGGIGCPVIHFNEYEVGSINGFAAYTFECFSNVTTAPAGSVIVSSSGSLSTHSALATAFRITVGGTAPFDVQVDLTTSVTGHASFTGAACLPASTDTAIAVDYDGTTARLYINGVVKASHAFSGTIVQKWYENFLYGATSGPASYPGEWTGTSGIMSVASIRFSNAARYAGTGYSPSTTQLAFDASTTLLMNFDPAYRFAPGSWWIVANGRHPTFGQNCDTFYPMHNIVSTLTENTGSVTIEDMYIASNSKAIYCEGAQQNAFRRLQISGTQCFRATNNSYYGTYKDIIILGSANHAGNTANSYGFALTGTSGLAYMENVTFQSCAGDWGFIINAGSCTLKKCDINTCNGQGGLLSRGANDNTYESCGWGDEGGVMLLTGTLFDQCTKTIWNMGGVFNANGGSGTSCVLIDGGTDYDFNFDIAQVVAGGMITFISPPVDIDGTPVAVRVLGRYQGQGLFVLKGQWSDGTGPLIVVPQEINGAGPITFPSDANYTPPWNAQAWGYVIVDTTACSGTHNLVLPKNVGKRTKVKVIGGRSVVPIHSTGTGPTLASGTTTDIYDDGTNIVVA